MAKADVLDLQRRYTQLRTESASWWGMYLDLCLFMMPYNYRLFVTDRNRGTEKDYRIYNNKATIAIKRAASGLKSGLTPPTRPWFALTTADDDLAEYLPVKEWLDKVTKMIAKVLASSNSYNAIDSMYEELLTFGTAASIIQDDFSDVIYLHYMTAGEYFIAQDHKRRVDTIYRYYQMTVAQVVKNWGIDNVSDRTRQLYERGMLDYWLDVTHSIEPREDRDPGVIGSHNHAWRSAYWENANMNQNSHLLSDKGYRRFPGLVTRWDVLGGDVYGHSAAMNALSDAKSLQGYEFGLNKAFDIQADPALLIDTTFIDREANLHPGSRTYFSSQTTESPLVRSVYEDVRLDPEGWMKLQERCEQRIEQALYNDVFFMLANLNDTNMTATEVSRRYEEKLMMLGPVVDRQKSELCKPLVESIFFRLAEANLLPDAPPEMQGHELDLKFSSILMQALQQSGVTSLDQFTSRIGEVAKFKPDVMDNIDFDKMINEYAKELQVPPDILVAGDQLILIRKQKEQAQQAAQQSQLLNQNADTYSKIGQLSTEPGTVAGALAKRVGVH